MEALQRKFNEETRGAKLELVLFQVRQHLGSLYILGHTLCMVHIRCVLNDKGRQLLQGRLLGTE